jgi:tripartite-type tricarboxylate transporter receptor subunit TctC
VLPVVSRSAPAQTYPSRPITMIVPFAPGGLTDVIGRVLAEGMRTSLGQPIIIENVGGANGSIGTRCAAERDKLAPLHVRHRDFLPYALSAPPTGPCARPFARPT